MARSWAALWTTLTGSCRYGLSFKPCLVDSLGLAFHLVSARVLAKPKHTLGRAFSMHWQLSCPCSRLGERKWKEAR